MNDQISVLVVEDEPSIRFEIVFELEDAGFKVFEAANADEAIAMLVNNLSIRVMFTDVDMPGGIDGLKLAAAVRNRWPPVRIIVTSGKHSVTSEMMPATSRFVPKPYDLGAVVKIVGEVAMEWRA